MKALLCIPLTAVFALGFQVDRTLNAPSGNITGLAFGEGVIWCLDSESSMCYGVDPVSGQVESSFLFAGPEDFTPGGLTYFNGNLFGSFFSIAQSSEVYWYSTSGVYQNFDELC